MEAQLSGRVYCPVCGVVEPERGSGECRCPPIFGSPAELHELIEAAQTGHVDGWMVGQIRDGSCREALEAIVEAGDARLGGSAKQALANIADEASMPLMLERTHTALGLMDSEAVRYLGRVGTPEAVEALVELLELLPLPARALAALGDERGISALDVTDPWHPGYEQHFEAMRLASSGPPPEVLPADPTSESTSVAWALDYELGDPDHVGTRFGGQPTWLDEPTWPLTTAGTPMSFWCQLRLPDDPDRMAYVFIQRQWDPISSEEATASVFLQPGGSPVVPWIRAATGPGVPDSTVRDSSYRPPNPWSMAARVPSLRPFEEPNEWDHDYPAPNQAWDKVGGTPLFLQGEPALEGYDFLCQFTAMLAGQEFGDGAQCYVFVNPDRGDGYFFWDCH